MAEIPLCPKFLKGHGCPRSDVVLLSDADAGGTVWSFGCRSCRTGFAVSKPAARQRAQIENELARRKSLVPTTADKVHFVAPKGGWKRG